MGKAKAVKKAAGASTARKAAPVAAGNGFVVGARVRVLSGEYGNARGTVAGFSESPGLVWVSLAIARDGDRLIARDNLALLPAAPAR